MNRRAFLVRLGATVATLPLLEGARAARAARAAADSVGGPRDSAVAHPDSANGTAPADTTTAGPRSLVIAAGGDTTLGYNLQAHFDQQLAAGTAKEQLWPLYFAGVRPILEAADVAVVNLECPFTERGEKLKKNFNFRARPELVNILAEGSVDVVSLANNHTADYGPLGVKDTIATLGHARIAHFGAGTNLRQARKPAVLERRGTKIGFIGYYFQAEPDMLEPEEVYATAHRAGVAGCYKDLACVRGQIEQDLARLVRTVDIAIPFFHWGREGSYEVRDYQMALAHRCVELGCKAVLGAHPHRLQGIEVYRGAPIFYSLGNFVYGGIKEPSDTLTMIARMSFDRSGVRAEAIPVRFTSWPDRSFQPYVLEGEERELGLQRIGELSSSFRTTLPHLAAYRVARGETLVLPVDAPAETLKTGAPR